MSVHGQDAIGFSVGGCEGTTLGLYWLAWLARLSEEGATNRPPFIASKRHLGTGAQRESEKKGAHSGDVDFIYGPHSPSLSA